MKDPPTPRTNLPSRARGKLSAIAVIRLPAVPALPAVVLLFPAAVVRALPVAVALPRSVIRLAAAPAQVPVAALLP